MSDYDLEQIRRKAGQIAARARTDPAFLEHLKSDPVGALSAAGLPDSAIPDFMREDGLESEVSGYMLEELQTPCNNTCIGTSCNITLI